MPRLDGVIGIDLGTESIKAVALESVRGESGLASKVLGVAMSKTEGMKKGVIFEVSDVARSIIKTLESLEKLTPIKNKTVYVGLGGAGINFQKSKGLIAISRADGEVSKDDIKRAISTSENNLARIQNREILHSIPFSFKIDNETATHDPLGLTGSKLEAETIFITTFSQHLKSALKTFDEAGLEIEDVFAGPLAMSYATLSKHEKEVGALALDIGASTTSLIIFEEGMPYSIEVAPYGSAHITQDIAVGLKTSLEEAEKLKINHGIVGKSMELGKKSSKEKEDLIYEKYSRKKLKDIIEARLDDIFELVEKHLKRVERDNLLAAGVIISGGGANLQGIADYARDYLNLPARVADPENIGMRDKIKNPMWAVATGIALMAAEKHSHTNSLMRGRSGSFFHWFRAFLP